MFRRVLLCRQLIRYLPTSESSKSSVSWKSTPRHFCKLNNTPSVHVLENNLSELKDPILKEMECVTSLSEALQVFRINQEQMNNSHLSAAFSALNKLAKTADKTTIDRIQTDPDFNALCQHSLTLMRHFTTDEVMNLLGSLCKLDIPLNCILGQATLQMIRHYINDLSLSQIIFAHYLLGKQPSQPLVDVLLKALPLALEIQLPHQLDPDNLKNVIGCLSIAAKCHLPLPTLERLGNIIVHQAMSLSKDQALSAIHALSELNPFPSRLKDAASEVLIRLTHYAQDLNMKESEGLVMALRKCRQLRNKKLFVILTHRCVVEQWSLRNTCILLSVVNNHQFISTELLNWTAECLEKTPELLQNDKLIPFKSTFEAFSEANHNIDRDVFTSLINGCSQKLDDLESDAPDIMVKLVMHLAVLECLPTKLLKKVFEPDFISKALKNASDNGRETSLLQCYMSLEQHARLEATTCLVGYDGPFLPEALLREAIKSRAIIMQPLDLVLQNFLEVGLGGPQFMLTGLWTKMGHFIDHLVVMRKEDFPVTMDTREPLQTVTDPDGLAFVEDVVLPEDAKVLAILVARQEWFNRDPPSLRGWTAFQQRTLAKLGYNPVILFPEGWHNLHSSEKIPYLMQEITTVVKEIRKALRHV